MVVILMENNIQDKPLKTVKCPCKDCKKRQQKCHSFCEDYKKYREYVDTCRENRIREIKKEYGL